MNFLTLAKDVGTKKDAIKFLQSRAILHKERHCSNGHSMILSIDPDRWRCTLKSCRSSIGLRKDTWFENSKIPFSTAIMFIYCWTRTYTTISFCEVELHMNHNTTVDWCQYMREVCAFSILQNPIVIGGPNMEVEIDETVISRRKYQRGRILPEQWLFGGICRQTRDVFLYAVPDRTKTTLHNCIKAAIAPGTTIYTDGWASYQGIDEIDGYNYHHLVVNHSENFVDPVTKAHTQNIENCWYRVKKRHKKAQGTQRTMTDSYICEFVWRERYRNVDLFEQILNDIRMFHNNY